MMGVGAPGIPIAALTPLWVMSSRLPRPYQRPGYYLLSHSPLFPLRRCSRATPLRTARPRAELRNTVAVRSSGRALFLDTANDLLRNFSGED